MERQITSFIRALRASDVRVSTGEAIDATRAVSVAGYSDRAFLKDALRCTLAKSPEEAVTFDELFDASASIIPNSHEPHLNICVQNLQCR